jgi:membrane-associated phospholipid phosphatase
LNPRSRLEQVAYFFSAIFHPAVMLITSFICISIYARHSIILALVDTIVFLGGLLPGMIYHHTALHKKRTLDYRKVANYNKMALLSFAFGMVVIYIVYTFTGVTTIQILSLFILFMTISGCIIINRFWKISFHSTIATICAALFIPFSSVFVCAFTLFGLIAGCSRLPLKLHTPAQVLAGWLYGFCVTSVLVLLLINQRL